MGESKAGKFSGAKCKSIKMDEELIQNHNQCKQNLQQIILMQHLARMEALNSGYDEAIMLNSQWECCRRKC